MLIQLIILVRYTIDYYSYVHLHPFLIHLYSCFLPSCCCPFSALCVHTGSGSVPDSSEPFPSGRFRVGFAFTLLTTDPKRTVRARFAVYILGLLCDRLCPNYMYLIRGIYHVCRVMCHLCHVLTTF